MKYSSRMTVLLFSCLLLVMAACNQEKSLDYPILESGYNAFKKTYWIDNNRVIFSGYPSDLPLNNEQISLYIWNTKTGEVKFHAKLSKSNDNFCFGDNVIVYDLEKLEDGIKKNIYMEGPLGKEQTSTGYQRDPDNGQMSPYTCINETPPPALKDRRWLPLKPEHGYLDRGPRLFPDQADPALYYLGKDGKRVKLPLSKDAVIVPTYYKFKEAYYLRIPVVLSNAGDINQEKAKCLMKRYWLYPDGRTEKVCIPYQEEWKRGSILNYPVMPGILLISHNRGKYGRVGHAGGYLIKSDSTEKIVSGYLTAASVSPDGCKVAFSNQIESKSSKPAGSNLRIIKLCNGKGE